MLTHAQDEKNLAVPDETKTSGGENVAFQSQGISTSTQGKVIYSMLKAKVKW